MRAIFRRPALTLFVGLHLFVLVTGWEKSFWPILNYTMFSRLDRIENRPTYLLSAVDRAGKTLNWDDLRDSFAPFPNKYAVNSLFNTYALDKMCRYLRATLAHNSGIESFVVLRRQHLNDEPAPFLTVAREASCDPAP